MAPLSGGAAGGVTGGVGRLQSSVAARCSSEAPVPAPVPAPASAPSSPPAAGRSTALDDEVSWRASEQRLHALLGRWWHDDRPAWTDPSWWAAILRDDVRRLLWLAPGPALIQALAVLENPTMCPEEHAAERMSSEWPIPGREVGWPCACQVVTAAAWDACSSWVAVQSSRSLVAAAGATAVSFTTPHSRGHIQDPAREELAHALRSSIPSMGNRIAAARALVESPRLLDLVTTGAISAWAARLVTDHLIDLTPADADSVVAEVAHRVLERLDSGRRPYHSAEVNRLGRAARLRLFPEQARDARVRAFAERRVCVLPRGDGMATLVADLVDVDAHRIHRRLTAIAAGLQADATAEGVHERRTRDQIRADALVDLLLATPTGPSALPTAPSRAAAEGLTVTHPPGGRLPSHEDDEADHSRGYPTPPRPDIQVVVTAETLLGLAEQPAHVPGLGPIPADLARALAADGRWRALVADASGAIVNVGTRTYTPSAGVARLVRAREPHCRFPGCHQPACRCDLDHAIPWPRGTTSPQNLGPLCRRHHRLKTHGGWVIEPLAGTGSGPPAGTGWRWTSPAGLTIRDHPDPPLP